MTTYYEATAVKGSLTDDDAKNLIVFYDVDYGCRIIRDESTKKFIVNWTDYVANEWTEEYDKMSAALTRLAMLAACQEAGWDLGFSTTPEQHEQATEDFMDENLG